MTKMYVCNACNKSCASEATQHCEQTCSDCMASPPCAYSDFRIHWVECNRHFRSQKCFANHNQSTSNKKSICERKICCGTCGVLTRDVTHHDCSKPHCKTCKQNRVTGHLCFMRPLNDVLSANADNVLYVFYDFESTQNKKYSDKAKEHVPNLVCVQQFCARCDIMDDVSINCERCGRRRHSLWNDPVGDLLTYLCEPRPWASKIVAIANNAKVFDLHFILNRAIMLK